MYKFIKASKHFGKPIDRVLVSKDFKKVVALSKGKRLEVSAKEILVASTSHTINQDDIKEDKLARFVSETGLALGNFEIKVETSYYKYNRKMGDDPAELEDFVVEYRNKTNGYMIPIEDYLTESTYEDLYEKALQDAKEEHKRGREE